MRTERVDCATIPKHLHHVVDVVVADIVPGVPRHPRPSGAMTLPEEGTSAEAAGSRLPHREATDRIERPPTDGFAPPFRSDGLLRSTPEEGETMPSTSVLAQVLGMKGACGRVA